VKTIDVSELPAHTLDHRSPIWWGNALLLVIESVMFAILVGAYFYLRRNFALWPPPLLDRIVPLQRALPELGISTLNLAVIVASCIPIFIADRAALKRRAKTVGIALSVTFLLGLLALFLRWKEFGALQVRWDDNAYASIAWMIVGMHFTHLIVGTLEIGMVTAWLFRHGLDDQHARDVRVDAVYWYWIAAVWVPLYALVYFGPRILQ
jgi:heme/copper-type cytochrome/quinol oxidase subunit 3